MLTSPLLKSFGSNYNSKNKSFLVQRSFLKKSIISDKDNSFNKKVGDASRKIKDSQIIASGNIFMNMSGGDLFEEGELAFNDIDSEKSSTVIVEDME